MQASKGREELTVISSYNAYEPQQLHQGMISLKCTLVAASDRFLIGHRTTHQEENRALYWKTNQLLSAVEVRFL